MSEWQPIETAPKTGRAILGFARANDYYWITVISWDILGGCEWGGVPLNAIGPTHWMPLPEPPK